MNKLSEKVNYGMFKSYFWKTGKFFGNNRKMFKQFIENKMEQKTSEYYDHSETSMAYVYMKILAEIMGRKFGDSKAEEIFFNILYKNNIQFKFQEKVGPYFPDFIVGKLIIEIDGPHHWRNKKQRDFDNRRDIYLEKQGYIVLRLRLHTLVLNIDKAIRIIKSLSKKEHFKKKVTK